MVWPTDPPTTRCARDRRPARGAAVERVLLLRSQRRRRSSARALPGAACTRVGARGVRGTRFGHDAADTLAYFARAGRACKVISGDNPRTVGAVAARSGVPGADHPYDARESPRRPRRARRRCSKHDVGVRSGHPAAEARDRRRAASAGSRGRDDGRRRERRAGAEGRRHRHRDGQRRAGNPSSRADRAARRQVRDDAGSRRRRAAGHRQRRAGREPVRDEDGLRDAARDRGGCHALAVSVPAPPPDDRQQPDDRDSRVLPRARAERAALRPRVRAPRPAVRRARPGSSSAAATFGSYAIAHYADDVCRNQHAPRRRSR